MEHRSLSMCLVLSLMSLVWLGGSAVDGAEDLPTKCAQVVQKVMPCLNYATGKAAMPTKECCDSSASIKETRPECMCYIIQQTHKGSPESKSLGIQEAKLLHLPEACKLKANISNCPTLLGLPADSPDAAIFKNVNSSSVTAPTTGAADTTTNSTGSSTSPTSIGSTLRPPLFTDILAVALAVLLIALPTSGFISVFT